MAKFPVELSDREGIVEGLNYVLSGPSGLGQNFSAFSAFAPTTLTGNYRTPYTIVPYTSIATGGSGNFTITVTDPSGLAVGQYVTGTGIGVGAQIAPLGIQDSTVTLTVANTGPVSGILNFYYQLPATLYVAPITIATIEWIDSTTFKINFASAQPSPPFAVGNPVRVIGSSIADYNIFYRGPGVVSCTTTYAIVQSINPIVNLGTATGGTVRFSSTLQPPAAGQDAFSDSWTRTDCAVRATVNGSLDRVFLAGQLNQAISYTATAASDLQVTVAINRYLGQPFSDPVNPDYRFLFDGTVSEHVYNFPGLAIGSGTLTELETIFSTVLDEPRPAYYQYRLEVLFRVTNTGGACQVTKSIVDLRALSAQVVKN